MSRFNILSPTAFPFLVLARSHHLIGHQGPLTENFSDNGSSSMSLSSSLFPFFSLLLVASVHAHVILRDFSAFFESSSYYPLSHKKVYISRTLLLAMRNRFLTDCRSDCIPKQRTRFLARCSSHCD